MFSAVCDQFGNFKVDKKGGTNLRNAPGMIASVEPTTIKSGPKMEDNTPFFIALFQIDRIPPKTDEIGSVSPIIYVM